MFKPKYFVKHCTSAREYLKFIRDNPAIEKIDTIVDSKQHWETLENLVDEINHGKIDRETLLKKLESIHKK